MQKRKQKTVGARVADDARETSSSRHSWTDAHVNSETAAAATDLHWERGERERERPLVPKFCQKPVGSDHRSSFLELDPRYTCGDRTLNNMAETGETGFLM